MKWYFRLLKIKMIVHNMISGQNLSNLAHSESSDFQGDEIDSVCHYIM